MNIFPLRSAGSMSVASWLPPQCLVQEQLKNFSFWAKAISLTKGGLIFLGVFCLVGCFLFYKSNNFYENSQHLGQGEIRWQIYHSSAFPWETTAYSKIKFLSPAFPLPWMSQVYGSHLQFCTMLIIPDTGYLPT